jgi:hypothetical protein
VVVADVAVLVHVLQVADDGRRAQVVAAGRDERLVHVQGDGASAADRPEVDPPGAAVELALGAGVHHLGHLLLRAADVRYAVNVLGQLTHRFPPSVRLTCGGPIRRR